MKALEITGQRFERLLVLEKAEYTKSRHTKWLCKCDCGKEKVIWGISLTSGATKSCGCLFRELRAERSRKFVKNLTGLRFNRLIVLSRNLEYQQSISSKSAYWNCRCDCGKETVACGSNLIRENVKSCGCLAREVSIAKCLKRKLPSGQAGFNEVFVHYKYSANKRSFNFNLSKEDFRNIIKQDCYYCGAPPSNNLKNTTGNFIYNGIDRMDNAIGYELSNCVPCCFVCNKAKMNMNADDFLALVNRIWEHHKEFFNG